MIIGNASLARVNRAGSQGSALSPSAGGVRGQSPIRTFLASEELPNWLE